MKNLSYRSLLRSVISLIIIWSSWCICNYFSFSKMFWSRWSTSSVNSSLFWAIIKVYSWIFDFSS